MRKSHLIFYYDKSIKCYLRIPNFVYDKELYIILRDKHNFLMRIDSWNKFLKSIIK